jgi:hypothetical protein
MNIADFNTLIAQSQKHNTPVFALTDAQIERQGVVLDQMKVNRENFRKTFHDLADAVIALTDMDGIEMPVAAVLSASPIGMLNSVT